MLLYRGDFLLSLARYLLKSCAERDKVSLQLLFLKIGKVQCHLDITRFVVLDSKLLADHPLQLVQYLVYVANLRALAMSEGGKKRVSPLLRPRFVCLCDGIEVLVEIAL